MGMGCRICPPHLVTAVPNRASATLPRGAACCRPAPCTATIPWPVFAGKGRTGTGPAPPARARGFGRFPADLGCSSGVAGPAAAAGRAPAPGRLQGKAEVECHPWVLPVPCGCHLWVSPTPLRGHRVGRRRLTQKVISRKLVVVPHLEDELGGHLPHRRVQAPEMLLGGKWGCHLCPLCPPHPDTRTLGVPRLVGQDAELLGRQALEGEDESPVEGPVPLQRAVMDVRPLPLLLQPVQPPAGGDAAVTPVPSAAVTSSLRGDTQRWPRLTP